MPGQPSEGWRSNSGVRAAFAILMWIPALAVALMVSALLLTAPAQAAKFVVKSTADSVDALPGDGVCADASGACTLRAAVMETNALAGQDRINLPAGTYRLAIPVPSGGGGIKITDDLRLVGAGRESTIVDGAGLNTVFYANARQPVVMSRLTVTGGGSSPYAPYGGWGIYAEATDLQVVEARITANSQQGIWAEDAAISVFKTEITQNSRGGIHQNLGTLRVESSVVAENYGRAIEVGGCVYGKNNCLACLATPLTVLNSTISGNLGGIWVGWFGCGGGPLYLVQSTVTGNESRGSPPYWAGITIFTTEPAFLRDSIIANQASGPDCLLSFPGGNLVSRGYNLDSDGTCNLTDPTDLPNTDPMLGPLQDNGGPTWTHALLPGSPAIGAIPLADCTYDDDGDPATPEVPLPEDQRGVVRPQSDDCDIGAYEVTACADGINNDADAFTDLADPGCRDAASVREDPQCQDGLNNDGDGSIDFDGGLSALGYAATDPDPQCAARPYRDCEKSNCMGCGLGAELSLLLAPLIWLRGRKGAPGYRDGCRSSLRLRRIPAPPSKAPMKLLRRGSGRLSRDRLCNWIGAVPWPEHSAPRAGRFPRGELSGRPGHSRPPRGKGGSMQAQQCGRCGIGVCSTLLTIALALFLVFLAGATTASGKPANPDKWWEVTPEEEVPSPFYDSILYSEIAPRLREIQKSSRQLIQVEVIGQSAGGRNLFLVTIARPGDEGRFGHYKNLRRLMTRDPDQALAAIDRFEDFKVPLFLNCSIHGHEYPGTDACMRLIEQLAYEDSPEVQTVLDNVILLINVVMNPDGRVLGTRTNANGFDINRDLITQSQPESRATVKVVADWNPMVFLDLHGFVTPMIIEPCTPPHNPNYEYDLYLAWALSLAFAMEDELIARTGETGATIPYLEWPDGWDDWGPFYSNSYAMLHGAYSHTLETPYRHEGGVDAHFAAVWGALKFVVENKEEMIRDQIEVYRRGALDLHQVLIPDELLAQTPWEQYNELTIQDFPEAYLIPAVAPLQQNPVQAAELVDFLLHNGVQVEKAKRAFSVDGRLYPGGTYVVWMNQPKRSVANVILEDGLDLSALTGITFYSPPVAWSHPLLWGVSRTVVNDAPAISTVVVKQAELPSGTLEAGWATAYAVTPGTLQGFQAINRSIRLGYPFYRASQAFEDRGRTFAAGTVVFPHSSRLALDLKKNYLMNVSALEELPQALTVMTPRRIAAFGDAALAHALHELDFEFDMLTQEQLFLGLVDLSGYDVFIHGSGPTLLPAGADAVVDFAAGGGDFIGLGGRGVSFAVDHGLIDATAAQEQGNGIVNIDLVAGHPLTSGFGSDDYAFVLTPTWFPFVGEGVEVAARLDADSMMVSGYWPDWQTSTAAGMPVMLFSEDDANPQADTVLIGFDTTFQGHPRNTFKLIGNAIYSGLDTSLAR